MIKRCLYCCSAEGAEARTRAAIVLAAVLRTKPSKNGACLKFTVQVQNQNSWWVHIRECRCSTQLDRRCPQHKHGSCCASEMQPTPMKSQLCRGTALLGLLLLSKVEPCNRYPDMLTFMHKHAHDFLTWDTLGNEAYKWIVFLAYENHV